MSTIGDTELERMLAAELDALTAGPVDEVRRRRHVAMAAAAAGQDGHVPRALAHRARQRALAAAVMGTAAALAVVLSLASARLLPDSVQAAVAHVAERVGLQLPTPDDDRDDAEDTGTRSGGSKSITADPVAATAPSAGSSSPAPSSPAPSSPGSSTRPSRPGSQPGVPAIAAPAPTVPTAPPAPPAAIAPSAPSTPPPPAAPSAPPPPVVPPIGGLPAPPAAPAPQPPPDLPEPPDASSVDVPGP